VSANINVVDWPITPLSDIPARLRKLADELEASNEFSQLVLVGVREDKSISAFGFGEYHGCFHCAGILLSAANSFTTPRN
jgi:hypothetical protein